MCRLYAFRANEQTKVECSLVHAQNALMEQSRTDREGQVHGHGWGVAGYHDGLPHVEKQTWAAYHGEHFKKTAARVYAKTVVAHVRRATVGPATLENTHPFVHGRWLFAHNGTIPEFHKLRDSLVQHIDNFHRNEIQGMTDSEHVFRYLLTLWSHNPQIELRDTVRRGLNRIISLCREIAPGKPVSLNVILTDGVQMAGARFGRTLWWLERDHIVTCEICGKSHVHHDPAEPYRAVEIASEPITHDEPWRQIPDATIFSVDPDFKLNIQPLESDSDRSAAGGKT
jgi:glutamine amidotransferase